MSNNYQKKLEEFLIKYPPKSRKELIKHTEYFTQGYMAAFEPGNNSPVTRHVVVAYSDYLQLELMKETLSDIDRENS